MPHIGWGRKRLLRCFRRVFGNGTGVVWHIGWAQHNEGAEGALIHEVKAGLYPVAQSGGGPGRHSLTVVAPIGAATVRSREAATSGFSCALAIAADEARGNRCRGAVE